MMSGCAQVLPFLDRKALAARSARQMLEAEDHAQHHAAACIAQLLVETPAALRSVALRAALHDVLHHLHERGEFDGGEVLGQIEEVARAAIPNLRAPLY